MIGFRVDFTAPSRRKSLVASGGTGGRWDSSPLQRSDSTTAPSCPYEPQYVDVGGPEMAYIDEGIAERIVDFVRRTQ